VAGLWPCGRSWPVVAGDAFPGPAVALRATMTDVDTIEHWPDAAALGRAGEALAVLRQGPRSPTGYGCSWCGVAHSSHWHAAPWQWRPGNVPTHLCADCHLRWRSARCHAGSPWRPQLAAEARGLELAPFGIAEVPSFLESNPPDRRGTVTRFAYLSGEGR